MLTKLNFVLPIFVIVFRNDENKQRRGQIWQYFKKIVGSNTGKGLNGQMSKKVQTANSL